MRLKYVLKILFAIVTLSIVASPVLASETPEQQQNVQVAWRLLDYLAVDYGGAVKDGKVISASEYAEMTEFSTSVMERFKDNGGY